MWKSPTELGPRAVEHLRAIGLIDHVSTGKDCELEYEKYKSKKYRDNTASRWYFGLSFSVGDQKDVVPTILFRSAVDNLLSNPAGAMCNFLLSSASRWSLKEHLKVTEFTI